MAYELRCIQYTNSCERGNLYDVSHGGGRLSYICRKLLMEAAVLTLHQVILMMLLIAVGIACARLKWFSDEVAQALSRFLLWFVTPALLIDAFSRDYNAAEAHNLLLSGLLGIVFHLLAAGIAKRRQGEMCRCAHECDVLELRLHGVSAHFCGVWRNRRFLRQCICRYVQSIPLDTGACSSAWSKGNNHAGRTVQCRRSRHDRRLRAVFLPLSASRHCRQSGGFSGVA